MPSSLLSLKKSDRYLLPFSLILAFLCLLLKTNGPYFPGKYLWSEDGPIFIGQAATLGWHALWTPNAGYLHLYDRLIALFCHSLHLNLTFTSYGFIVGWLILFAAMIAVIAQRARSFGLASIYIYWLVILITLQPSHGEIFFNLTNSQWLLGATLSVYLLTRDNAKPSLLELLLVTIGCLSGPFSIFIFPLFCVNILIEKSLKNVWPLASIMFICGLIQAVHIGLNGRVAQPSGHDDLLTLVKTGLYGLSFWAKNLKGYAAAGFFWLCVLAAFIRTFRADDKMKHKVVPLLLFAFGFICLASAIYDGISAAGSLADRYYWVPYALFFFSAALISTCSRKIVLLTFISMSFICIIHFKKIDPKVNYQFSSYIHFSNYTRVTIPINPQVFYFESGTPATKEALLPLVPAQRPAMNRFLSNDIKIKQADGIIYAKTKDKNSSLIFKDPFYCPKASDIGVEIVLQRNKDAYVTLLWSNTLNFTEKNVISYWHRSGEFKVDFAFPNNKEKTYIQFSPTDTVDEIQIKSLDVYCLP